MPKKPTGEPNGRPKTDRSADPIILHDDAPTYRLNMPVWWIAAAQMEASLIVAGKWGHGSLRDLARHFTSERGGGKSVAAVTKARSQPGYRAIVAEHEAALRLIAAQDAANPEHAREHRADVRASINAAYDAEKDGD